MFIFPCVPLILVLLFVLTGGMLRLRVSVERMVQYPAGDIRVVTLAGT